MLTIQKEMNVNIGYSDHTLGIEVPIAAVAMGAVCIEKHFTLNREMEGPDHKASLEPQELKAMVTAIRNIEKAMGNGIKMTSPSEEKNMVVARKSIHLNKGLNRGQTLTENDLIMMRPGDGISPMDYEKLIGRKVKHPLDFHHKINLEDLV
jgi:N,N'-diacetyllegionaminate synthase